MHLIFADAVVSVVGSSMLFLVTLLMAARRFE